MKSASLLRRVRGHTLALSLSPSRLADDDFMFSRQAMLCTSATPGDWAEDSRTHHAPASLTEARKAHRRSLLNGLHHDYRRAT